MQRDNFRVLAKLQHVRFAQEMWSIFVLLGRLDSHQPPIHQKLPDPKPKKTKSCPRDREMGTSQSTAESEWPHWPSDSASCAPSIRGNAVGFHYGSERVCCSSCVSPLPGKTPHLESKSAVLDKVGKDLHEHHWAGRKQNAWSRRGNPKLADTNRMYLLRDPAWWSEENVA